MHTAVMTAEAVCILNLMVLLFSMLFRKKTQRTSVAFIICLGVAAIGTGMDLLSYVLEQTSAGSFWLITVNMLSFFGYDFELMAFALYVWAIVAEKGKAPLSFVRFIGALCLADILFIIIGTVTGKLFRIEGGYFVTGPWYDLGGVTGFIVLVSLLAFSIRKTGTVGRTPVIFTLIFFVFTYISIFITLFTGIDSYMYVCMSLIMLLVYIILQTSYNNLSIFYIF